MIKVKASLKQEGDKDTRIGVDVNSFVILRNVIVYSVQQDTGVRSRRMCYGMKI